MKKLLFCLASIMLMLGCESSLSRNNTNNKIEKIENETWTEVPQKKVGEQVFIPVESLISTINTKADFDEVNRTLMLDVGEHQFYFVHMVPVVQKNGLLLPVAENDFNIMEDQAWLSLNFLRDNLDIGVRTENNKTFINTAKPIELKTNNEVTELSYLGSVENVIEIMDFLESPIKGAQVDTIPSHLPGAKRAYRNGVHEGMDWYGFSTGVSMNEQTKVFAMGDGVVVRADHEYNRYSSKEERNRELGMAAEVGFTPAYILDRLRGRQVWIQYENGLQARFAHLDRIPEELQVGDGVSAQTLIGYVGNTGTSGDVKGDRTELHLHLDLLYRGELFWKGLSEKEIEKVLKTIFTN
ncbi:MAG TPA: M23 family metallopeptidase [Bacillales bacterium]|nr:M23 family metallopeptidase [Bacillales bacterium]